MTTLTTPRLVMRDFRLSDAADLYAYAKDIRVGPNAGWAPHKHVEESRAVIKMFVESGEVWAIEHAETGRVVGSIGLHPNERGRACKSRMIGYVLSPDYWGQGLMTECARRVVRYAFESLDLDILTVNHYPHNERSGSVIRKCGFVYEGTLRMAAAIYDGTIYDLVTYSMKKPEFYKSFIGDTVTAIIDRPLGSLHPRSRHIRYTVNYGYIGGIYAGDGKEQDAYILGVNEPLERFTGRIAAVLHRTDDADDKWILVPNGVTVTPHEIRAATHFVERYFTSEIYM